MRASYGTTGRGPFCAPIDCENDLADRDPIPERPYRMQRKTYAKICAEIEEVERPLVCSRIVKRARQWIPPLSY
jgi:hypothetical protein